jgi:hypothetical protein
MTGLLLLDGSGPPVRRWSPCPRTYAGNMCGIFVDGLPPVPGGGDPRLVLSWFLDRYSAADQFRILGEYARRGLRDILVSWPDSRAVGKTPEEFAAWCWALYQQGFEPNVFLLSKNYDAMKSVGQMVDGCVDVLTLLRAKVGRWCVGWELSLWLTPADVQALINAFAPFVTPWGGRLYVHFQTEYASFDYDGPNASFAGFWNRNMGKLTGLFYQSDVNWPTDFLQAKIKDSLDRFAGNYNCSPTSGFGHPFDDIALETQAEAAFAGRADEATQDRYARAAVQTEPTVGPFGPVCCMGAGNGVGGQC